MERWGRVTCLEGCVDGKISLYDYGETYHASQGGKDSDTEDQDDLESLRGEAHVGMDNVDGQQHQREIDGDAKRPMSNSPTIWSAWIVSSAASASKGRA